MKSRPSNADTRSDCTSNRLFFARRRGIWTPRGACSSMMTPSRTSSDWIPYAVAMLGPLALCAAQLMRPVELLPTPHDPAPADCPALPVSPVGADPQAHQGNACPSDLACHPDRLDPHEVEQSDEAPSINFGFIKDRYVILNQAAAASWGRGPVRGRAGPPSKDLHAYMYAEQDADLSAIPEEFRGADGSIVDVYGDHGKICEARLGALTIVAEFDGMPFFSEHGFVPHDDGTLDHEQGEALRASVFEREDRWLTAQLELPASCDGAVFARSASLPAPLMWTSEVGVTSKKRREDLLSAADARLRDEYERYLDTQTVPAPGLDGPPDWDTFARSSYQRRVYRGGAGLKRVLFQSVGEVPQSCGDGFGESHSKTTLLRAGGLEPLPTMDWLTTPPVAFLDVDRDGRLETLIYDIDDRDSYTLLDVAGESIATNARPYYGCRC